MRISKIKINNFKSFGNNKNTLCVSQNVTAIIGKNESGKNNLLEAIDKIHFFKRIDLANCQNKFAEQDASLDIMLSFSEDDTRILGVEQNSINLKIDKFGCSIEGGSENFIKDVGLHQYIDKIKSIFLSSDISGTDGQPLSDFVNNINENFEKQTNLKMLLTFLGKIENNFNLCDRESAIFDDSEFSKRLKHIKNMFPSIFFSNNDNWIESTYNLTDINNITEDKSSKKQHLISLLKCADVTVETVQAALSENDSAKRSNMTAKIKSKIKNNVFKKFFEFYKQEDFYFDIVFEKDEFNIHVLTNSGNAVNLSERSNGLRWYLNLFIELQCKLHETQRPVVFVLDEPGVHLHVDAQRELLKFFDDLTQKGHQIIYSTHSPSMLNTNELVNIKAIKKDDNGYSKIYSYSDTSLSENSKMETLSPLLNALGMSLQYSIGPSSDRINVIVEGITDYYYLTTIQKHFEEFNSSFYFIPLVGVQNAPNLISIMFGWGLKFKVLLDYDREGFSAYRKIKKELGQHCVESITKFIVDKPFIENEIAENYVSIEGLIDAEDSKRLNYPYNTANDKTLAALSFYELYSDYNAKTLSNKTMDNFKSIFTRLLED